MAALLNTERGVTGRKLNFHLLQTVPLLCSAPVGPETMTQRIQEAQHHKSRWLVVSSHVTHSFPLYDICGRRCENPTLQKGKAGQVQEAESCRIRPLLCRLPRALTTAGLPTILQVLSFLPSSCFHDSSSPRQTLISSLLYYCNHSI